jgi:DMSO/TMAO reductase YedYZ molybdopterin-dependent catalytic subunit
MKRSIWWIGALSGFLTSLVTMALSYLGNVWLSLPFFPFDIFDWLTRHLPGSIIEAGLSTMIRLINALKLGPTAATGKLAEQVQALGLVVITGVVFGLVLAYVNSKWPRWLVHAGLAGGVVLWVGVLVVEVSLPASSGTPVIGLAWLLFLLVGWGGYLARFLNHMFMTPQPATREDQQKDDQQASILNKKLTRRSLLKLSGAGLVSAIVLLLGLQKFRQAGTTAGSPAQATPGGASTVTPHSIAFGPEYTSGPAASPSPAQLAARIAPAPGTRPEIDTPDQFYRVDINALPPEINAAGWLLRLDGLVQKPITLTVDDLWARPSVSQAVTLSCISNLVGGDLIGTNYWTGFRFKDLLAEAGVLTGAGGISITSKDGFYESIPLTEAMDERTLLVYAMNGNPLTASHGFPLRLYIPGHYGMKLPKWIMELNVTDQVTAGYWPDRGWSQTAVPMTTSVIDTDSVNLSDFKTTGIFPLGGIAWAGMRGISKVEVQIDDSPWVATELRNPAVSPLTWVQWRYDWKPASGSHTIKVRATDGTGTLQDPNDTYPQPEGATGIDSVTVTV